MTGDVRQAAIGFEAVKVSMSQTKDGTKITLVIHPNDTDKELFSHPVGSRYQVALVLLNDDGQPVVPKERTDGERAVQSAAMLCKEPEFQRFLHENFGGVEMTEEDAAWYICHRCEVGSRSELRTNQEARNKFDELKVEFSKWRGFP